MVEEPADTPTADDACLVGRSEERATIAALLTGTEAPGGALLIRGERGIGLTAAAGGRASDAPGDRDRPQRRRSAGRVRAAVLGPAPAPRRHPGPARTPGAPRRSGRAVRDRGAASSRCSGRWPHVAPVAILVDDAHLLDAASCGVLGFVGRRIAHMRVGIVLAAHGTNPALDALRLPERPIGRLDADSARCLVETVAPGLTVPWRERILEDAQGLPLALIDLARAAASDPDLASGIPRWR